MNTTDKLKKAPQLLPCPFCGDEGEKGIQAVTLMNAERTSFKRVSCRCCGATCPEPNWNHRAAMLQQGAQAVPTTRESAAKRGPRWDAFGRLYDSLCGRPITNREIAWRCYLAASHTATTPPAQQDAQAVPPRVFVVVARRRQPSGRYSYTVESDTPLPIGALLHTEPRTAATTPPAQQNDIALLTQCLTAMEAMMQEFRALDLPYGSKAYALAKDCRLDLIKRLATEPNAETVAAMQEARQMAARDNKD